MFIASSIVLRATRGCRRTLGQMQDLLWSSWRMECAAYARPAEEWVRPASRACGVLGGRAGVPTPPLDPCRARLVKLASTAWPDEPSVWECDRGGMCARAGATGVSGWAPVVQAGSRCRVCRCTLGQMQGLLCSSWCSGVLHRCEAKQAGGTPHARHPLVLGVCRDALQR